MQSGLPAHHHGDFVAQTVGLGPSLLPAMFPNNAEDVRRSASVPSRHRPPEDEESTSILIRIDFTISLERMVRLVV